MQEQTAKTGDLMNFGTIVNESDRRESESSSGTSTSLLERPDTDEESKADDGAGDGDRFAHYVSKDSVERARALGRPVVALCGKVWFPKHSPANYPVCPECKSIYSQIG